MLTNIKENKYTYLAVGIIAGLIIAYAHKKFKKKE